MKSETDLFIKMKTYLQQFSVVEDKDWNLLKKELKVNSYQKGDYFIKEGELCNHIGFLNKGIGRTYYTIDGREMTSYFNAGLRNLFVCSFTSFITRKPSFENIHFLEDTELFVLEYEQLQILYERSSAFQRLGRKLAEFNYVLSMERIYSLQHETALGRYNQLIETYPGLMNLVPHHYIASYLGITPESLSRVRKEAIQKNI